MDTHEQRMLLQIIILEDEWLNSLIIDNVTHDQIWYNN